MAQFHVPAARIPVHDPKYSMYRSQFLFCSISLLALQYKRQEVEYLKCNTISILLPAVLFCKYFHKNSKTFRYSPALGYSKTEPFLLFNILQLTKRRFLSRHIFISCSLTRNPFPGKHTLFPAL